MRLEKNRQDQMTPAERITSAREGKMVDRVITIPFMGELKCYLSGISIQDFWFDAEKIAQAERIAFNRWGYDRIVLGPNTRGIVEALGGKFIYPENGVPYADVPMISDYKKLDEIKTEVDNAIDVVEDPMEQMILRYRYLEFLSMPDISVRMHYSLRWTKKLHRRALDSFERGHP